MDGTVEAQQPVDDVALMARVAQRDRVALRALYELHAPVVHAVCLRIVRDPHEAEQLLIDVFASVWERPDRFDAARGTPGGFLTLMARSRALDHVRGERRRDKHTALLAEGAPSDGALGSAADEPMMADERRAAVVGALDVLEPNQRDAVRLSFYDGLSHAEIAERLGRPLGTVKTQVRQGLLRMRDALRGYWEGRMSKP